MNKYLKYAVMFGAAACAVLVVPMLNGQWPGGEDWPKCIAAGLVAALGLHLPSPAKKDGANA